MGVGFASTGDYGAVDPEYPAFSPIVAAVGGTSLTLNADNSYNSETGWGYFSSAAGTTIASGGGISLYEPELAYQQRVQSTGSRSTPDVLFVADPAAGAWVADPSNLNPADPFEIVGGTSLSAPAWAGLLALVNQGRAAAGESTLNSTSPTDTQEALYMLPQTDYNVINSGTNGFSAEAGYNLVTGLGTPVANFLVPDLIAYQGPATIYSSPTVAALQSAGWAARLGRSLALPDILRTEDRRLRTEERPIPELFRPLSSVLRPFGEPGVTIPIVAVPHGHDSQPAPEIHTAETTVQQSNAAGQPHGFTARLTVILLAAGFRMRPLYLLSELSLSPRHGNNRDKRYKRYKASFTSLVRAPKR